MQKADKLVNQATHALSTLSVRSHHVEVGQKSLLQCRSVLRPEHERNEELENTDADVKQGHMVSGSEERKVILSSTFK